MRNFYDYISSDLTTINPSKSILDLIIIGTNFNTPKNITTFGNKENNKSQEKQEEDSRGNDEKLKTFHVHNNSTKILKTNHPLNHDKSGKNLVEHEENKEKLSMKDFLAQKSLNNLMLRVNFENPSQVIKVVEKELKKVKVMPRSESFISPKGEYKPVTWGKRQHSYEEPTLSKKAKVSYEECDESKKKKKLLEYIMVN